MIQFDVITIFPRFFDSFVKESLINRAQKQGLIRIKIHDLRDFSKDKHRTVDDKPFGGGRGMVIKIEPLYRALQSLKPKTKNCRLKTILFSPRGKKFTQKTASRYSGLGRLVMVCGRYEGVDERVNKLVDERVSVGDYVLMGGEVAAMAVIESVARLIPGVLGHSEKLGERMFKKSSQTGFLEYPQYTRPEVFSTRKKAWRVPAVLLKGHHRKIKEWREKRQKVIL